MGDYALFGDKGEKVVKHYQLRFGSGDALEPFYYSILYALRNNRQYRIVKKVLDYYNISPNSQQFGFATQNLRQEISSASGLLGQIGGVVKSIVAMKKDLQRIKECLDYYKDKGRPNELVLKGVWADFVDSKTGPASLTQAAQKLEFFVARDWFFKINSAKEAEELEDVPGNVKAFLAKKYREYSVWKKHWKTRLEDMKGIIQQQIKASKQTVNLYKQWIQPLLRNIEALKLAPDPSNPDLLKIGGNTFSKVKVVAWNKVTPRKGNKVSSTYKEPDKRGKDKDFGEIGKTLYQGKEVPFMTLIEIELTLKAGKQGTTETIVDFYAKVYDKKRFEELYWDSWLKDPAEEWIENLLLKEELPIELEEAEGAEEPKDFLSLIGSQLDEAIDKVKSKYDSVLDKVGLKPKSKSLRKYDINKLVGAASAEVKKDVSLVYFVVKKRHGMLAELAMYM
ncbi:hypothetical protein GF352_02035 [archaeon]|nr:hypothetical protein [archaeon]